MISETFSLWINPIIFLEKQEILVPVLLTNHLSSLYNALITVYLGITFHSISQQTHYTPMYYPSRTHSPNYFVHFVNYLFTCTTDPFKAWTTHTLKSRTRTPTTSRRRQWRRRLRTTNSRRADVVIREATTWTPLCFRSSFGRFIWCIPYQWINFQVSEAEQHDVIDCHEETESGEQEQLLGILVGQQHLVHHDCCEWSTSIPPELQIDEGSGKGGTGRGWRHKHVEQSDRWGERGGRSIGSRGSKVTGMLHRVPRERDPPRTRPRIPPVRQLVICSEASGSLRWVLWKCSNHLNLRFQCSWWRQCSQAFRRKKEVGK